MLVNHLIKKYGQFQGTSTADIFEDNMRKRETASSTKFATLFNPPFLHTAILQQTTSKISSQNIENLYKCRYNN